MAYLAPLGILLLAATSAHAQDWDAKMREVCSYDGYCSKASSPPDPNNLKAIEGFRDQVHAAARIHGVDPKVVAAVIVAEHSMNVGMSDAALDRILNSKIARSAAIYSAKAGTYSPTFGFGQIHPARAFAVEAAAAQREGRPRRSDDEVLLALKDPTASIYYVAGLCRQAIDIYAANGFDIAGRPGVVATLYNLGKVQQRVQQARQEREKNSSWQPRINYFGLFVEKNWSTIARAVGGGGAGAASAPPPPPSKQVVETSREITVRSVPDGCFKDAAPSKTTKIAADKVVEYISKSVDCELGTWSLIRSDEGTVGWIKDADLKPALKKDSRLLSELCKTTIEPACSRAFPPAALRPFLIQKMKDGRLLFRSAKTQEYGATKIVQGKLHPLGADELAEINQAVQSFKAEVSKELGIKKWDSVSNPYEFVLKAPLLDLAKLGKCTERAPCYGDARAIVDALDGVTLVKQPTAKDIEGLEAALKDKALGVLTRKEKEALDKRVLAMPADRRKLADKLEVCRAMAEQLPTAAEQISEIERTLASVPAGKVSVADFEGGFSDVERTCRMIAALFPKLHPQAQAKLSSQDAAGAPSTGEAAGSGGRAVSTGECLDCKVVMWDLTSDSLNPVSNANAASVRATLPDAKAQDEYLYGLMKAKIDMGRLSGGTRRATSTGDHDIQALSLSALAKEACVGTIFAPLRSMVPDARYASGDSPVTAKTVFGPVDDYGNIMVELAKTRSCPGGNQ